MSDNRLSDLFTAFWLLSREEKWFSLTFSFQVFVRVMSVRWWKIIVIPLVNYLISQSSYLFFSSLAQSTFKCSPRLEAQQVHYQVAVKCLRLRTMLIRKWLDFCFLPSSSLVLMDLLISILTVRVNLNGILIIWFDKQGKKRNLFWEALTSQRQLDFFLSANFGFSAERVLIADILQFSHEFTSDD